MRPRRAVPCAFWTVSALVAIAAWSLIALALREVQRNAVADAAAVARNLARGLAQYEESSVQAIDLALLYLRDDWLRDPGSFAGAVARHEAHLRRERIIQVAVVDRDGWLVFSRLPQSGALNFADRDYFQAQKASGADALIISTPVLGRVTRQWAIQFSRPIHDRRKAFAGLLVVAVPVPALERVYGDIELGQDGVVTLVRSDGAIIARTGDPGRVAGASFADFPGLAPGSPLAGDFRGTGRVDGVERFFSYRRLEHYPLTLYVGQSVDHVLGPYRKQRALAVGGGLLATVLLVLVARLRVLRARLEAAVVEGERRLLEERERLMLELHDGCIQSIYAVGLRLEHCRGLVGEDPRSAARTIAEAEASLNLVIQELRAFIAGDRPAAPSPEALAAEMRRMLPDDRAPALSLELEPAALERLSAEQAAHVLRIAREALSNVARHARARTARAALRLAGGKLCLEIADDGAGFAAEEAAAGGLGLHHIRVRAEKLGGRASMESAPGQGTRVRVEFPPAAA